MATRARPPLLPVKLPTITQRSTLKLVRKPLPPARKVILDAKTKARRKRAKHTDTDGFGQAAHGQWFTNSH